MSTFIDEPEEWQRLDWMLLQNSPITLYYERSILAEDVNWFSAHKYKIATLASTHWKSPQEALAAIGTALDFPDYFGGNFNALNDCLSDVAIPQEGGLVLVLQEFQAFSEYFPSEAQVLLDILASNARQFLLTGQRFLALVHSTNPRQEFNPVGATPVMWNPREWLNSKRGL